ncbi:hypothetical protein ACO0LF_12375 [Undibacterium sp. Di27W]|uniref:hypothetical protein n=1 Tax=Undibacterium sp. Di27W TaxID=3413036 RepID=UPI003BF24F28
MKFFSNLGWFDLLAVVFGMTIGAAATHVFDTAQIETTKAAMAGVKAQHSDQQAQAAQAALQRLQTANERADALQTALDVTEQRLSITKTELNREIQKSTTGRACLNGRTVGLLNRAAAGSEPATLSNASSGPVETNAGIATDTDIATWINSAAAQYNVCRARLDALIDWHVNPAKASTEHEQ